MSKCVHCIFDLNRNMFKSYKKNDIIFFEGDHIDAIYRIKEGIVKLEKLNEQGEVIVVDIVKDTDYIALLSVMKGMHEYLVSARCVTDVVVTPIMYDQAQDAYQNNVHFKDTCLKCAAHRLAIFQDHTFLRSNNSIEERIISTLKYLSSKFGYETDGELVVELPISKSEFASMVGLRRETLSRKLSSLQGDGTLVVNKNIYKIKNM